MINPIRILVGEILKSKTNGDKILITGLGIRAGFVETLNLKTLEENIFLGSRIRHGEFVREGYVGNDVLIGEDWLCHENRCFPSSIADSCIDCPYSCLIKQRKQYFCIGDEVYDPIFKSYHRITSIILAGRKDEETKKSIDYGFSKMIGHFTSFFQLFELSGFSRKTYFTYDEIRLVKRARFILNTEQLNYICNDLCIFGRYSKECKSCKTNEIRNDLQRNC